MMPDSGHPGLATLRLLADGQWHTGVAMAESLRLSRTAIWKQVAGLRALGVMVIADRRQGYRLEHPLDLLDAGRIRTGLEPRVRTAVESLEVLTVTLSTNLCLTGRPPPPEGRSRIVAADYQTGGRGRRGRRWLSPLGHGICLSVARSFATIPRDLPALSLVAGIAVVDALTDLGAAGVLLKWPNDVMGDGGKLGGILVEVAGEPGVLLKWPNDVMAGGGKLGGILVEVAGEPGGPLHVVIGIGLNVRSVAGLATKLHEEGGAFPAVALDQVTGEKRLNRSDIVAGILNSLHAHLEQFEVLGWTGIADRWQGRDFLRGLAVVVTQGSRTISGTARGIADDGALIVEVDDILTTVVAGDVTLRQGPGNCRSGAAG
ncbi:MAG: biotin--[acetyl-CoA-carboxylase] ligase [Gammaproteobacteria bacterium PRO9]|nr:biotin--[acetyl-CoA-carboxylase] ligase [Gammaproteobacteria bacterium PRO9]